jgi:hypothetical protein
MFEHHLLMMLRKRTFAMDNVRAGRPGAPSNTPNSGPTMSEERLCGTRFPGPRGAKSLNCLLSSGRGRGAK